MEQLQYKTRGMLDPRGKPKVYFCAHPKDYGEYFDPISDELLQRQDCSIWHCAEPVYDEDFLSDLKTMQLFVLPVTARLLSEPNEALDVAFPFAIENHIPVLPLMQEPGLEKIYNQKCGNLQYLDRVSLDSTAIPYEEKLSHYLSTVLIGDELAERIRAAFDAYVFLSYRKKDRKYAQELMRLIHRNDFCRDIAIWYDEFLNPGENFNESIRLAMQKSDLFVLTVTPNLINEINYIMTTEYPMAQEAGKTILPAELVATDRTVLSEKYPQLPECTDVGQEGALSEALWEALRRLAIRENDTPEHDFFIGLAYLSGVDVEVDHERAVSLITSAAEAGVVEATTKLVEMYKNGVGVSCSYETAAYWQAKKARLLVKIYQDEPSEENLERLFWAFWDSSVQYEELDIPNSAMAENNTAVFHLQQSGYTQTSLRIKRCYAWGYYRWGTLDLRKGNLKRAKGMASTFHVICRELAEQLDTPVSRRDLAISYEHMGAICEAEWDLSTARAHCEKACAIFEKLKSDNDTAQARMDLYRCYERIGNICKAEGKTESAEEWIEKSLALCESLISQNDSTAVRRSIADIYKKRGDICKKKGNPHEARAYYEEAFHIYEKLAKQTDLPGDHSSLRDLCRKLWEICRDEKDYHSVRKFAEIELAYMETQAEAQKNATGSDLMLILQEGQQDKIWYDLSLHYEMLGSVCVKTNDRQNARLYLEKAVEISEMLVEDTDNEVSWSNLARHYVLLASVSPERKTEYLDKAEPIYQQFYKIDPDERNAKLWLMFIQNLRNT